MAADGRKCAMLNGQYWVFNQLSETESPSCLSSLIIEITVVTLFGWFLVNVGNMIGPLAQLV